MTAVMTEPPLPPVAMTFDDGPDPVWTPRVLDALDRAGIRASFFPITRRAAAHPDLVAEILARGHEVGLHGARHLRHTRTPRATVEADTVEALETLDRLGVRPSRWRLPWGAAARWSAALADAHGLAIVGWSADSHDWRGDPAPAMLAAVAPKIAPGAVVLMHDGLGPGSRRLGCAETVTLIASLAALIRGRGLATASLDGLGTRAAWA
jgi:peptidoglycan/xylan/chitin deacetylase (PgdA/CDA1 family)